MLNSRQDEERQFNNEITQEAVNGYQRALEASVVASTYRGYQNQWHDWVRFCGQKEHIVHGDFFCTSLTGIKRRHLWMCFLLWPFKDYTISCGNRLTAMNFQFQIAGYDDFIDKKQFQVILTRISRGVTQLPELQHEQPTPRGQKLPVSVEMVMELYQRVVIGGAHIVAGPRAYYDADIKLALVACAFVEVHHGARGGNWVLGKSKLEGHTILSEHITVYVDLGRTAVQVTDYVQMRRMVANRFNTVEHINYHMTSHKASTKGESYIINYRTGSLGERLCVELLIQHASNAQLPSEDSVPFFSLCQEEPGNPLRRCLTTEMLSHTAKYIAKVFGFEHKRFGAHSFRHCSKTEMTMQGIHESDSRRVLGHTVNSTSAQLYNHAPVNLGALTYTRNPGLSIADIRGML